MTFTERNFPSPEPAGEVIPDGVRGALLRWFSDQEIIDEQELWPMFCQREGYARFSEMSDDIERRFGLEAGTRFATEIAASVKRDQHRTMRVGGHDYNADAALR